MSQELPQDWQSRMVEMIRGTAPLDATWFAGGPALDPQRQIQVYRDQYRMRLLDALIEEVPGLCALLSPEERDELLLAYLREHPSRTWTLNRVADPLAGWLEARGAPLAQVEMARLDRAVQQGFEAADEAPLRPEDLAELPPLRLQAHVSLLRLQHSVHRVRAAVLTGEPPPELETGDFPVVVFRRNLKMRHWEAPAGAWAILKGLDEGLDVGGAIEGAWARGLLDPARVAADVQDWFRAFAERELVARVR